MRRYFYDTLHPEIYHGYGKKPPFFEGWYYKLVDQPEQHRYAIIPGVFITENPAMNHAFIQVLNGSEATYHQYPLEAFWSHREKFEVQIGESLFRADCISLNIHDEALTLRGDLRFNSRVKWPVRLHAPGIMGWYGWIPFMECYHGVVSLDHLIAGALTLNGQTVDFTNGRGYIEKDWGQNFPSAYVWQQTNHFHAPGTSLTASIAMIPFYYTTFRGFIIGFWHHGQLFRFATYTGAVTDHLEITDHQVSWTVSDGKHRLEMVSQRGGEGGMLKAPFRTEMHKRINETMTATVHVRLTTRDGKTLFEGEGRNAGLEVYGDLERLTHA